MARGEQLAADEITAEDEEKIDPDPAKAIDPVRQFKAKQCGVVNDDDDDGECAEKIETRLAFAILEARVDCGFGHGAGGKQRSEIRSRSVSKNAVDFHDADLINNAARLATTKHRCVDRSAS